MSLCSEICSDAVSFITIILSILIKLCDFKFAIKIKCAEEYWKCLRCSLNLGSNINQTTQEIGNLTSGKIKTQ